MDGGSPEFVSRGLSGQDAAARLKAEGPNTLPQADRRTFVRIVLEILREPMFALLLGAAPAMRFSLPSRMTSARGLVRSRRLSRTRSVRAS